MFIFGIFHEISISHGWSSKQSRAWCRYQVKRRDLLVPFWGVLFDFVSECRSGCRMRVFNILLGIWKSGAPVRWMGRVSWWEGTGRRVSDEPGRRRRRVGPPGAHPLELPWSRRLWSRPRRLSLGSGLGGPCPDLEAGPGGRENAVRHEGE